MSQNPSASDWASDRGEKWSAQLSGMEATLRPIDLPLLAALRLSGSARIAEIGCGGGGTSLELARHAPAGSEVHAYDISPKLIELARARMQPSDRNLAFHVADVATSLPAQPYQRLFSRFGVMFFDDPAAAFANLWHWLVPGGRLVFAVWADLAANPWLASVREVVGRVIALPALDLQAPGPYRYADASKLVALLKQAGFSELDVSDWQGALPVGGGLSAAAAAQFVLAAFSNFDALFVKAGQGARAEALRLLTTHLLQHERDGVVQMQACVHIVTGARA
jgi:SAM-dependent methyltransferase